MPTTAEEVSEEPVCSLSVCQNEATRMIEQTVALTGEKVQIYRCLDHTSRWDREVARRVDAWPRGYQWV